MFDLDENLHALGSSAPFVEQLSPEGAWVDGLAVDACGNLYVANFMTLQLLKITPDAQVSVYVDWSDTPELYGHGVIFGNGVGGFREDALYLPMPYNNNTVQEIVVGIPSRTFAGTVLKPEG